MADDNFHLQIPTENIRNEKYDRTGGGKGYPRDNHIAHGNKLKQETILVREVESARKDFNLTTNIFLQIETPADFPIKNQKLNIESLGFDLISYSMSNPNFGIAKISKSKFRDLDKKLVDYIETPTNVGKSYFSAIENFSSVDVETKLKVDIKDSIDKELPVIFNLYNTLPSREKFAINQAIITELNRFTSDVEEKTFANGTTSIACSLSANLVPIIAQEFSSIKEVKLNQTAFVENAIETQNLPDSLKVTHPKSNSSICVIDSGVKNANGIFDNILTESLTYLPSGAVDGHYEHGTFVASRCVFGDNIDACLGTNRLDPYCKIVDVQTFGVNSAGQRVNPTDFHLRRIIEEVVDKRHKTIKVYNLSIGFPSAIRDNEFSDIAKLLDFLSKKYKVMFVVAAGNINKLLGSYPARHFADPGARIGAPAESILSLTVGAISIHEDANSLSKRGELAPFSKIGPGADSGIKPEVVAHGGNLILKYDRAPRVSTYGISTNGKRLAVDVGTSFSAPLISQYAQRLFDAYPVSGPNLVKALLCHFTISRQIPKGVVSKDLHCTGFGEPIIERATVAGPHSAAFIFEGQLDQENYQYISFHIPKTLASENKKSKLKIRITLIYDPPVDPDNNAEYSKARISFSLEKPTDSGIVSLGSFNEGDYHIPWNPIIRFEKVFTRNYLSGNWEIRLRLYTRGKLTDSYKQDYAVVIEIIDEKQSTNVYHDIVAEYGSVYKKIKIKAAA